MANFAQKMKVSCSRHGFIGKVFEGLVHPRRETMRRRFFSSPVAEESSAVSAPGLHRSTPWLVLPPEIDPATGGKMDCFYSLTAKEVYKLNRESSLGVPEEARCFTSSRGWLGFIDPNCCSLYLANPFRLVPPNWLVESVVQLPSIETLPSVLSVKHRPSSSSIDQFMVVDHSNVSKDHRRYINPESLSRFIVKHVSLSCDVFNFDEQEVAIALAVQGEIPQLAFCRVGVDDTWTTLFGSRVSYAQTVCSVQGRGKIFYSMYSDMYGHGIDAWKIPVPWKIPTRCATFMYQEHSRHLHDKFMFEPSESNLRNQCKAKRYLVDDKSSGGILLVIKHTAPHVAEDGSIVDQDPSCYEHFLKAGPEGCHNSIPSKTLRFDVYKVDMMKRELKRLKFIGDRVIFLGLNQSFVLSARKFPGLRPNSIYFTDDDCASAMQSNPFPYGGHDLGIFNLKDNSIEPCYQFNNDLKEEKIRPPLLWVAPNCSC